MPTRRQRKNRSRKRGGAWHGRCLTTMNAPSVQAAADQILAPPGPTVADLMTPVMLKQFVHAKCQKLGKSTSFLTAKTRKIRIDDIVRHILLQYHPKEAFSTNWMEPVRDFR